VSIISVPGLSPDKGISSPRCLKAQSLFVWQTECTEVIGMHLPMFNLFTTGVRGNPVWL
jgi:hypothetical protein